MDVVLGLPGRKTKYIQKYPYTKQTRVLATLSECWMAAFSTVVHFLQRPQLAAESFYVFNASMARSCSAGITAAISATSSRQESCLPNSTL